MTYNFADNYYLNNNFNKGDKVNKSESQLPLSHYLPCYLLGTQLAAAACHPLIGACDRHGADAAATSALRDALNCAPCCSIVSIGEGERDQAPMLFRGEILGTKTANIKDIGLSEINIAQINGTQQDIFSIAVDPLEGTNLCATNQPNSICILMYAPFGSILDAPDCYMQKIVVSSPQYGVDIDLPLRENIALLAKAKGCHVGDLTIAMLRRPRHEHYYDEVFASGANLYLFDDGDILMSLAVFPEFKRYEADWRRIDMYYGIGGAPEGVITAGLMRNLGGFMQGRLVDAYGNELCDADVESILYDANDVGFENMRGKRTGGTGSVDMKSSSIAANGETGCVQSDKSSRAGDGINFAEIQENQKNIRKKYEIEDMVKKDCVICISGVTSGFLLRGVGKINQGRYIVESCVVQRHMYECGPGVVEFLVR